MEQPRTLTLENQDSFFEQGAMEVNDTFTYSLDWFDVRRLAFDNGYMVERISPYVGQVTYIGKKRRCGGACACGGNCACKAQEKSSRRVDVQAILADPVKRRHLSILAGIALQAREGRDVTYEEMAAAYDKVVRERDG